MAGYSADVRPDQFLSTISIAASNDDVSYVGDIALPIIDGDFPTDQYVIYGTEDFKQYDLLRGPMTSAREIRQSLTKGTYVAKRRSAKTAIPDERGRFSVPPLNARVDAATFVGSTMRNDRERAQLKVLADPTQIPQNLTLSGTSLFSDYNNSVPLSVIRSSRSTVRLGCHRPANTALWAYDAALVTADHPSIKDLIKAWDREDLNEAGLPPSMRGLTTLVSSADTDTVGPGSTSTNFQAMFSKSLLIFYRNPNPGRRAQIFGATIRVPNPDTGNRGIETKEWYDTDKSGWWVEGNDMYAIKLFTPNAGFSLPVVIS